VGASGSGKSSLVRAGLLPLLETGVLPGSDRWRVLVSTPTGLGPGEWDERQWDDGADGRLVVVDQFEEAFVAFEESARRKFFDRLSDGVAHGSRVVLTLRSDLYGQVATHPGLASLVSANTMLLGPMSADELRRAAEAPAVAAGLVLEPGLVDRLVADLSGAAGALPLLAAALRATWEQRTDRRLAIARFARAGGGAGAVDRAGAPA